ncbi:MAG: ROK family glucokinase [Lachnospiraceae bacterium]|nr:ROK family glucokinase [Lachnospiraceae bacterium]
MDKYCFGVDIGGTTVKIGFFTAKGELLNKWEIPTRTEDGGKYVIPDIAKAIKFKITEKGLTEEDIVGIGLGTPGPVDQNGVIHKAVNLGWGVFNLEEEMKKQTGIMTKGGNDATIAALGEMWKGGAKGYSDIVLATLGTGVGGGIIIGGKVFYGSRGAGGEIGHMHLNNDETEMCGCGNKGCFEQYGSATGLVRIANRKLAASGKESILRNDTVTAKAVFDAVKEEDELAMEIADEYGKYLAQGFAVIAAVVDPQVFVIGGGVSKAGDVLIDYIKKYYKSYAFHANHEVDFKLATLGNDAGIYGAVKLVLDET